MGQIYSASSIDEDVSDLHNKRNNIWSQQLKKNLYYYSCCPWDSVQYGTFQITSQITIYIYSPNFKYQICIREKNEINFFIDIHLQIVLLHILYASKLNFMSGQEERVRTHTYMCVKTKGGQYGRWEQNSTLARAPALLCTVKNVVYYEVHYFPEKFILFPALFIIQ